MSQGNSSGWGLRRPKLLTKAQASGRNPRHAIRSFSRWIDLSEEKFATELMKLTRNPPPVEDLS